MTPRDDGLAMRLVPSRLSTERGSAGSTAIVTTGYLFDPALPRSVLSLLGTTNLPQQHSIHYEL